jgi:hypothetical protein
MDHLLMILCFCVVQVDVKEIHFLLFVLEDAYDHLLFANDSILSFVNE